MTNKWESNKTGNETLLYNTFNSNTQNQNVETMTLQTRNNEKQWKQAVHKQ
jgi:hypothetical protein